MTKTGRVYKIVHNQSDLVYIGSTLNQLKYRWRDHKNSYKKWQNGKAGACAIYEYFDQYGVDNFTCILIKEYKVADKKQLYALEQLWINKLRCVNKQCAFQPIKKERKKQYYKDNQQQISERKKQYYDVNQQKILEKNKQYYKDNQQKLLDQKKQYYKDNQQQISEYKKQYYKDNKQKLSEKHKQYREDNQQKIKEKNKQYYDANQQKILEKTECSICKSVILKKALKRHQRSAKCRSSLNTL